MSWLSELVKKGGKGAGKLVGVGSTDSLMKITSEAVRPILRKTWGTERGERIWSAIEPVIRREADRPERTEKAK